MMKIPIAFKLVIVSVGILLAASIPIAFKSAELFEKVSREREEDTNLSTAVARATEVESILNSFSEKVKVIGSLMLKEEAEKTTESSQSLKLAFERDRDLYSVDIYQISSQKVDLYKRIQKNEKYAEHKKTPDYLDRLRRTQNFPVRSVAQGKIEIQNATLKEGIPILSVGIPLVKDDMGRITHVAVADLALSRLQKAFNTESERTLFLVDREGTVLAHQNEDMALNRYTLKDHPIVARALTDSTPRKQNRFFDQQLNGHFIGAYVRTPLDVTVVSLASEEVILEPARLVKREAFFITGLVLSSALFIIFIFSTSLTSPIEKLAALIARVSQGDFDVSARAHVKSKDEVGDLAEAFDKMTDGLKERDKVKSLFSKFHGSSIAEEMINRDISVGGSNKEVTVFFSDIRGFTAFSEGHSPEAVVEMLNEYFSIMVKIINANHGIVDKFIGDAIMAVWGAPKSTGQDAYYATKACLEMRQALHELNQKRLARGHSAIMIGMGLHSGRAISGTIGSEERMEYTVIGDAVNMTSRIEASTKAFGADLLISEDTANAIKDQFAIEQAGVAEVKGKTEPLKLFKVRGYKTETGDIVEVRTPYSDYEKEAADKVKIAS